MSMKQINSLDPFAVALGYGEVDAQITFAAADVVVVLHTKRAFDEKQSYDVQITDTGFRDDTRDKAPDETAKPYFVGTMTAQEAAAFMWISANADEPSESTPGFEVVGENNMDCTVLDLMYAVAERWIKAVKLPRNLRFIP